MDLSDQILKLSKQLFETIQKFSAQIEITINKKEIRYKDKSRRKKVRVQLELNIPSSIHHPKGNVGGKIAFGQEVKKKEEKNEKKVIKEDT
ncbi:hypothetical protein G9A89_019765 [Geosiphon pyriformis]|nr:hypothetical protein G9A89_019765 [Geosiphon pyriformis]